MTWVVLVLRQIKVCALLASSLSVTLRYVDIAAWKMSLKTSRDVNSFRRRGHIKRRTKKLKMNDIKSNQIRLQSFIPIGLPAERAIYSANVFFYFFLVVQLLAP